MSLIPIQRAPGVVSGGGGGATYTRTPLVAAQDIPAGFPVPIHTDMFSNGTHNNAIFSNIQADGGDLRVFEDSNFSTQLPLELVEIDTGAPKIIGFFRTANAVSNGNTIAYLRTTIGGGESQPGVSTTFGRNSVWQDYAAVYHDCDVDSSGNNSNATHSGSSPASTGLLNGYPARGYGPTYGDTGTDNSTVPYTGNPIQLTISGILYEDTTFHNTFPRILVQNGGSDTTWFHNWNGAETNVQISRMYTGQGDWKGGIGARGNWYHALVTIDSNSAANDATHYENGASLTPTVDSNSTGSLQNNSVTNWMIGNRPDLTRPWKGLIGGVRIRAGTVDTAWAGVEDDGYRTPTAVTTAGTLVTV